MTAGQPEAVGSVTRGGSLSTPEQGKHSRFGGAKQLQPQSRLLDEDMEGREAWVRRVLEQKEHECIVAVTTQAGDRGKSWVKW